jgi:hypothetical protein
VITFPPLLEVMRQLSESLGTRRTAYRGVNVAVTQGVALLDERLGRKFWLERINLAELDVASPRNCVACQVTGLRYTDAVGVLGAPDSPFHRAAWGDQHGFSLDLIEFTDERHYAMLTREWTRRVEQLRANQSAEVTV